MLPLLAKNKTKKLQQKPLEEKTHTRGPKSRNSVWKQVRICVCVWGGGGGACVCVCGGGGGAVRVCACVRVRVCMCMCVSVCVGLWMCGGVCVHVNLLVSFHRRKKACDHRPRPVLNTSESKSFNYSQGQTDNKKNFVVTVGFTTKVDHQKTSKILGIFSRRFRSFFR